MTQPGALVAAAAMVTAAITHGYIFARESVTFTRPSTQRMLDVEPAHAPAIRLWAYHQGIYNLLLGCTGLAGAIALSVGAVTVGSTLTVAAGASMLTAATTLIAADPRRSRIAGFVAQALPPAIALTALLTS